MFSQKLVRQERLKRETAIAELFNSGLSHKAYPYRLIYRQVEDSRSIPVKFSISVPKKRIKLAVRRNRIKRKIRTYYRLNKQDFIRACLEKQVNIDLMFVYIGNNVAQIDQAERSLKELLNKIVDELQ